MIGFFQLSTFFHLGRAFFTSAELGRPSPELGRACTESTKNHGRLPIRNNWYHQIIAHEPCVICTNRMLCQAPLHCLELLKINFRHILIHFGGLGIVSRQCPWKKSGKSGRLKKIKKIYQNYWYGWVLWCNINLWFLTSFKIQCTYISGIFFQKNPGVSKQNAPAL